jgi:hypothetical protein
MMTAAVAWIARQAGQADGGCGPLGQEIAMIAVIHLPVIGAALLLKVGAGVYLTAWIAKNVANIRALIRALDRQDYSAARSIGLSILNSVFSILVLGDFGKRLDAFVHGDHSSTNVRALSAEATRLIDGVK